MSDKYMSQDDDSITQIRIDVAVLKTELKDSALALKLAHDNTLAWVGLSATITSVLTVIVVKFFTH